MNKPYFLHYDQEGVITLTFQASQKYNNSLWNTCIQDLAQKLIDLQVAILSFIGDYCQNDNLTIFTSGFERKLAAVIWKRKMWVAERKLSYLWWSLAEQSALELHSSGQHAHMTRETIAVQTSKHRSCWHNTQSSGTITEQIHRSESCTYCTCKRHSEMHLKCITCVTN